MLNKLKGDYTHLKRTLLLLFETFQLPPVATDKTLIRLILADKSNDRLVYKGRIPDRRLVHCLPG